MIDKNKTYRTRDGREVRIYATDGFGGWAVHGAVKLDNTWKPMTWYANGTQNTWLNDDTDLFEVKPRIHREYWVNVYTDHVGKLFELQEMANTNSESERIACVKVVIDCEEGDGL